MSDEKPLDKNGYMPSIVDGKISRLSVSQLSRFDTREHGGCKRKWWFKYIGKIPDPPSPHAMEGISGHARFQAYYSGQPVLLLDCDLPALEHLPRPGSGALPEVRLERLTLLRIPFQGSMDLVHGRDVYDYKYQSQIRPYSEPTAQVWGYLEELRLRYDSIGSFSFNHVYIAKKQPWKAKKVPQTYSAREIERSWLSYGPLVKEMQDCSQEPDHLKVEANKKACYAYGPCPYLSICNRVNINKEEIEMGSFLDEIAAAKKEAAAVTLPEVNAAVLPPDAPPPDAVPTAPPPVAVPPVETAPAPKKRGRPKKAMDPIEEGGQEVYARPAKTEAVKPEGKVTSLRLGLTVGLPEYSSAHVFVEMSGGDEEEMTKAIEAKIVQKLERLIPAYKNAIAMVKAK